MVMTSEIDPKLIELNDSCPEYSKKFTYSTKYVLMDIFEEYMSRFCFGIQGYRNPTVEVHYHQGAMNSFKEHFPFKYKEGKGTLNTQKKELNKREFKKFTWKIGEKELNEFFCIFKNISPICQRVIIQSSKRPGIWRDFTKEEINSVYGNNQNWENNLASIKKDFVTNFLQFLPENDRGNDIHRIWVKFGDCLTDRRLSDFCFKITMIEEVGKLTKKGILKFSFFYDTYLNGNLVGLQAIKKMSHKKYEKKLQKKRKIREEENERFMNEQQKEEKKKRINKLYELLQKQEENKVLMAKHQTPVIKNKNNCYNM